MDVGCNRVKVALAGTMTQFRRGARRGNSAADDPSHADGGCIVPLCQMKRKTGVKDTESSEKQVMQSRVCGRKSERGRRRG